jgi:hypothetical protein
MGVYDFVLLEPRIELPSYPISKKKEQISWQTRAFSDPMYRLHCISNDGYLYRADHNYDDLGFAESHGSTGSFDFLEVLNDKDYDGYPRSTSEFDWYRIRYVGEMRITAQNSEQDELVMYDIDFARHSVKNVSRVDTEEIDRDIRSKLGNLKLEDIEEGQTVYDRNESRYKVLDIIEEPAKKFVVKPEQKERGHVIYKQRTVADMNPEYPADDFVVKLKDSKSEREVYFPISRVALNYEDIF